MTDDPLARLRNLPSDELRPILQKLLDTDAAPVHEWSVTEIGRSVGQSTTGIYHVAGYALTSAGERPWSLVVKVLGPPRMPGREFDAIGARRELEVYRSGLVAFTQSRVRPPHCYALHSWNDLDFIWMEDLSAAPQAPWLPEYFVHTAQHFGHFNGYWSGAALPEWTWLSRGGLRETYRNARHAKVFARLADLQNDPEGGRALPQDVLEGLAQLWQQGEELLGFVETTTKCLCHGDCHVKNLFPMPDAGARRYTIAIDWAHAGVGYLGADIGLLLASAAKWLELSVEQATALVDPLFEAYLAGLAEVGWAGNEEEVQLTYLTCLGMGEAMRVTNIVAMVVESLDGRTTMERLMQQPAAQVFDQWAHVLRFFVGQKDRAIQLARTL